MEVKRKQNESIGALLRRFSNLVKNTRLVPNAKSKKYYQKDLTPRQEKNRAIMGNELRVLRQRLERLGKFDDEAFETEKKKIKQKLNL